MGGSRPFFFLQGREMHYQLFIFKQWIFLIITLFLLLFLVPTAQSASSEKKLGLFQEDRISADELRQKQLKAERFIVFDARDQKSYQEMHMEGAILPRTDDYYKKQELYNQRVTSTPPDADKALIENMKKYPKNTAIVTYCNSGNCQASAVMALQIKRMGFNNVRALEDGIQIWQKKGYPVRT